MNENRMAPIALEKSENAWKAVNSVSTFEEAFRVAEATQGA